MISKSQVAHSTIVFHDIIFEFLNSWFILEMSVGFEEPLIQFNDLS